MTSLEVVVSVVVICVVLGASVVVLGDGDGVPPAAITVMSAQFLNSSPQPAEVLPRHVPQKEPHQLAAFQPRSFMSWKKHP
mmetsp:Transcript_100110/g.137839  ORF Transcript_100110/g.137839 Transcript_100110/m.137839 type:complete len:81 (-) Transcript_100110:694-936(-)